MRFSINIIKKKILDLANINNGSSTKRIFFAVFVQAAIRLIRNNGIEFAGYLAFLFIFSLFPFIFILVSSVSLLGEDQQIIVFINKILANLPPYLIDLVKSQVDKLISGPPVGLLNFIFLGAIWTASSSVASLKQIFNKTYAVRNPPNYLITRIRSIVQFISAILIILISMIMFIVLPVILSYMKNKVGIDTLSFDYHWLNYVVMSIIIIFVISTIYYTLTNRRLNLVTTMPGAAICYIIWYLSAKILTFYTNNFFNELNITYGSLATIVIVLMFFYVINLALLYGAEINYQILELKNKDKFFNRLFSYDK